MENKEHHAHNKFEEWKKTNYERLEEMRLNYLSHPCAGQNNYERLDTLVTKTAKQFCDEPGKHLIIVSGAPNSGKSYTAENYLKPSFDSLTRNVHTINWDDQERSTEEFIKLYQENLKSRNEPLTNTVFEKHIETTIEIYGSKQDDLSSFLATYKRDRNTPDDNRFLMATYTQVFNKITNSLKYGPEQQIIIADVPGSTGIPYQNLLNHPTREHIMFETRPYANPLCAHIRSSLKDEEIFITFIGLGPGPNLYKIRDQRDALIPDGRFGSQQMTSLGRKMSWAAARFYYDTGKLPENMKNYIDIISQITPGKTMDEYVIEMDDSLKPLALSAATRAQSSGKDPRHFLWEFGWDMAATCLLETNADQADLKGIFLTNPKAT